MVHHKATAILAASLLALQGLTVPARADNQMGYQLLSQQQVAGQPRRGGALGMDVGPGQHITSSGISFELLRVNGVHPQSAGAQAGFSVGDQIIAINGQVFASVVAFAGYIGSLPPGQQITIDYLPAGGGPQQAQRVGVTVGAAGRASAAQQPAPNQRAGLSTGTKVAIGVGAAALFGCYELGCFSHRKRAAPLDPQQQQQQNGAQLQQNGVQPQQNGVQPQ